MKSIFIFFLAIFIPVTLGISVQKKNKISAHCLVKITPEKEKRSKLPESSSAQLNSSSVNTEYTTLTSPEKISLELEWFIHSLKAFVKTNYFEYSRFATFIQSLSEGLAIIEFWVDTELDNMDEDVQNKYVYAKDLFHNMWITSDKMKLYNRSKIPGANFIDQIFELKVRLLAFRDSHGNIDPETDGFEDKVYILMCAFQSSSEDFEFEKGITKRLRILYREKAAEVRDLIEEFRRKT